MGRELKIQKIKRVHAFFFLIEKKNSFSFLWFFFFFFFLMVLFVIIDLIVILHLFLFLTNLYRFLCILYILVFQFSITSTFSLFHQFELIWVNNQFFCKLEQLVWGLKFGIPAHFTLRAQSPSRGALLLRMYEENPLMAQEYRRGQPHAQRLTKCLKKRTDSVQKQYKRESCQHHNVEPSA